MNETLKISDTYYNTKDGWQLKNGVVATEKFAVSYRSPSVRDYTGNIPKEYIHRQLAEKLSEELMKKNAISFVESYDSFTKTDTTTAELNVAPCDASNALIQIPYYRYKSMSFSPEEIENALLNTYPERFL